MTLFLDSINTVKNVLVVPVRVSTPKNALTFKITARLIEGKDHSLFNRNLYLFRLPISLNSLLKNLYRATVIIVVKLCNSRSRAGSKLTKHCVLATVCH